MFGFFSLSWVVALATIQGMIQSQGVFLRTPKTKSKSDFVRAMTITSWETGLGVTCGLVGVALIISRPALGALIVTVFLLWEAAFYLSAPAFSVMSERGKEGILVSGREDIGDRSIVERRAAIWAAALIPLVLLIYGAIRILPQPSGVPVYATFQPPTLVAIESTQTPTPTATEQVLPTGTIAPTLPAVPTATAAESQSRILAAAAPTGTAPPTEARRPAAPPPTSPNAAANGDSDRYVDARSVGRRPRRRPAGGAHY